MSSRHSPAAAAAEHARCTPCRRSRAGLSPDHETDRGNRTVVSHLLTHANITLLQSIHISVVCCEQPGHSRQTNKYVRLQGLTYMSILRPHAARFHEWRMSCVTLMSAHLYDNVYIPVGVARALSDSSDFGLLGEQSSQKMGDSLP